MPFQSCRHEGKICNILLTLVDKSGYLGLVPLLITLVLTRVAIKVAKSRECPCWRGFGIGLVFDRQGDGALVLMFDGHLR